MEKFTDVYGRERKAGEEWLVTHDLSPFHILDVFEEFVSQVPIRILNKQQYCVVLNPMDKKTGQNQWGAKDPRVGPCSFFLQPGEELDGGIKDVYLLKDDEALLLKATEKTVDVTHEKDEKTGKITEVKKKRQPGDRWMEYGPARYVPPVEVQVLEMRKKIPLDKNEGIYVRDTRSGLVRPVIGETYMLKAHEELWNMELGDSVEQLLNIPRRQKHRVVSYQVPFNNAVQVYDYKQKTSRILLGPSNILLNPDEQFTVTALSGGKPKKPGMIKAIAIQLGPDFSTDIIQVETSDHAALRLQISYNW